MSANLKRICRHCGTDCIPIQHRCAGKTAAIDLSRSYRYANGKQKRVMTGQVWLDPATLAITTLKGVKGAIPRHV